jgi:hypothetical protein
MYSILNITCSEDNMDGELHDFSVLLISFLTRKRYQSFKFVNKFQMPNLVLNNFV